MKKTLTALASLSMMVALVGSAQARTPARHSAAPAVSAQTRAAEAAKLRAALPALRHERKTLKHTSSSRRERARLKRLMKPMAGKAGARAATAGENYWYSLTYYGVVTVDRYYDNAYYVDDAGDYCYVIYDNYVIGGMPANVYYYEYLCNYGGTTWWDGASGWSNSDPGPDGGFGPNAG